MKYNIFINQLMAIEIAPKLDIIDWAIFDYIKSLVVSNNKKLKFIIVEDERYIWVNYNHLLEEMPMMQINQKASITTRLQKLKKEQLIKTIAIKGNVYITMGEKAVYMEFQNVLLVGKCEWCGREDVPLIKHHHPVTQSKGGKDTVNICPNCHYRFHYDNFKPSLAPTNEVLVKTNEVLVKTNEGISSNKYNNNTNNNNTKEHNTLNTNVFNKNLNFFIDKFKLVNPSYERLFSNKTQRTALERLMEKFNEDDFEKILDTLPITNKMKFFPTITTPCQLEEKIGSLIAAIAKNKTESEGKQIIT